jgi:formylglycine-generating enzyme required for sulfatase activity
LPGDVPAGDKREPRTRATRPPARDGQRTQATRPGTVSDSAGAHPEHYDFLAPPEQPDEIGRLGGYRVLKVLGAGGMGVVFQAEDPRLKRKLALKAMLPALAVSDTARQRFLREAQAAASLSHDHIVPIFQVGEDRGVPFIAMPFLKGEPLDERLQRQPVLPLPEVLRIARETATGLAAAHEQGLIHRDIKPANLWLEELDGERGPSTPRYRVKVLDFGLARAAADSAQLTQSGVILGTPAYMAPEQANGQPLDGRCDLFSLGCVVYRLCTGRLPFNGPDTVATLLAVATEQPPPPCELNPRLPRGFSNLVMQLLAKDPADRPPSARALLEALQDVEKKTIPLGGADHRTREPAPPPVPAEKRAKEGARGKPRSRKPARKQWLLPALAAGVLCVVLVVAGIVAVLLATDKGEPVRAADDPHNGAVVSQMEKPVPVLDGQTKQPTKPALDRQAEAPAKTFTNALGMQFVLIPAGTFTMGSSPQEIERCISLKSWGPADLKAEGPEHEVEITQPFYMGVHAVTVGQFRAFVNDSKTKMDDAWLKPGWEQTDAHPVVNVYWNDAVDFCTWLSQKEGKQYHLPTEARWEYSCRAGRTGARYSFGDEDADLGLYAWYQANAGAQTHPVGQRRPNAWGLHDMHGNVCEWCLDNYDGNYYKNSPRQDPTGPVAPSRGKACRGGSWLNDPVGCRCAARHRYDPASRFTRLGFRVVLLLSSAGGERP